MDNKITIRDFVRDSYKVYGREVNIGRNLPHLYDGLKPSSQRLILASLEYNNFIKTATLIGTTMGKYHPHGDLSLPKTVANLVNKLGIFEKQGNFGYKLLDGTSCEPAATRYTEVRLNPAIRNQIMTFAHLVPTEISEMGYTAMQYIPTPIPFALVSGDIGISIGINQKIPAFSAKSIIEAYRSDDPTKLESQYGLELIKNDSNLTGLWTTGAGRIHVKMKTIRDNNGITIEGNTTLFVPPLGNLMKQFKYGNVDFQDLSDATPKVRFSKPPRVRRITVQEIQNQVEVASNFRDSYYIRVHNGDIAQPISMRTWVDVCYKNYSRLALSGVQSEIVKNQNKIVFYSNLKKVYTDLVTTSKTESDLSSELNIPLDIVKSISSKSASYVRGCDTNKKIAECEQTIKSLQSANADKLIDTYVGALK